MVTLPKHVGGK